MGNVYQTCLLMHEFIYRNQALSVTFQILFIPTTHVHTIKLDTAETVYSYPAHGHQDTNLTFRDPKLRNKLSSSVRSMSPHSVFNMYFIVRFFFVGLFVFSCLFFLFC